MEEILKRSINSLQTVGSPNALTIASIRQWLLEYKAVYEVEIKQSPESLNEPHYDLLMNDSHPMVEAIFIVALFNDADVTFIVGCGASTEIRSFAEKDFPENPLDIISSVAIKFCPVSQPTTVSKSEVDAWLEA